MYRSISLGFYLSLMTVVIQGCSAAASGSGTCKRACGNRPVGGGNLKGVAYTDSLAFTCSSAQSVPQQTLYFLIYEDNPASANTGGAEAKLPERMPKPGIAFTPMVPAGVTLDSPESDWCTDTCGIAEIKFTPICGWKVSSFISPLVPGMTTDTIPKTTFSLSLP